MAGRALTLGFHTGLLAFGMAFGLASVTSAAGGQAGTMTFTKDVAPIFQAKCQSCHQPNSIAPMSLISYKESRPWARSIKDRVMRRQMPPWHIDPSVGVHKFKNDMSLSEDQIQTIVRWVDAGAPEGDPRDMPPPKPLLADNMWQGVMDGFGEPDMVIRSPEYTMPAQHQD
ncbi:MAG: cytochrome c, partial [Acidobacteriota bacterium]|nr:cytochrome c [Acidobacteriota bacterium]